MSENWPLNEAPSFVQAHLAIMQGVIHRMAENSRPCILAWSWINIHL